MRINSLRLNNFRQHADSLVELDSGLTGIIGPNGAGKSTILEAIAWALYGNPAARGTRESIRFLRAPPRSSVRVELDFELGAHRYRVARGLSSAEVYLDGAPVPIATGITAVTELLQRRLGMSRLEFFNTYFTGQKELNVMAAMGPSERAQFLSRVLGYERLRGAQDLVRDRRRLLVAEVAGLSSALPDESRVSTLLADARERLTNADACYAEAEARRVAAAAALAVMTPRWERAGRERERMQALAGELAVAESEETSLAREGARIEGELRDVTASQRELAALMVRVAPIAGMRAEMQALDQLRHEEGRRQALLDAERALLADLAALRERLTTREGAPVLEGEVTAELAAVRARLAECERDLEERRTDWVRDKQEAETRRQALRAQYNDLRQQRESVVALGEDGTCPTCSRSLGESYRTVLDLLDTQIETVRVDGRYFKDRTEQLGRTPEAIVELEAARKKLVADAVVLERTLAKVQAAVSELASLRQDLSAKGTRQESLRAELAAIPGGYDPARHEALTRELQRLLPEETNAARLAALVEREPRLRNDRERMGRALTAARERVEELRARRSASVFSEDDFLAVKAAFEAATAAARVCELEGVRALAELGAAQALRESAERTAAERQRMQHRLAELQTDKRLHDELDRAFTDLRAELNLTMRPELSELASSFLSELTDGRYSELELDDQYNIIVLEDGVPKPVISGGEEDLANLVLRLAISQMIAERAGQAFSLLILDEVFGSLDDVRRQGVVSLLRKLHDRFEQVILITHIESVREGVDRVITLRYDEELGSSIVEQRDAVPPPELAHGEEDGGAGGEAEGAFVAVT